MSFTPEELTRTFNDESLPVEAKNFVSFIDVYLQQQPDLARNPEDLGAAFFATLTPEEALRHAEKIKTVSFYGYPAEAKARGMAYICLASDAKGAFLECVHPRPKINYAEKGKLERQVSPPLSAYKYKGHSNTDITYSNKSFGLLFE